MRKLRSAFLATLLLVACKDIQKSPSLVVPENGNLEVRYAQGFQVEQKEGYQLLTISNPWPGADKEYRYALVNKNDEVEMTEEVDNIISLPLERIVVTSTTHIPSLEMLDVENKLVGFPNLDYISSEKTRQLIENGVIKELGKNEDLNTEVLIDMQPDLVVTFAVDGGNKTVSTIEKTGIPVVYNSDWTETHPLGKAEWIKFFGVLLGEEEKSQEIFNRIESDYQQAKELASQAQNKPTVLSGAMYKDIWYLPQGNSWAAQFIADANGDYLWKDSEGTGSLSLNLESVLEKGESAEFWIGPGQFTTKADLGGAHEVYTQFAAFDSGEIYTFTSRKGPTGGVIYYELAPNRPDLVLKDMVKILHPELLPDYELFFFSKLD